MQWGTKIPSLGFVCGLADVACSDSGVGIGAGPEGGDAGLSLPPAVLKVGYSYHHSPLGGRAPLWLRGS